MAEQKEHRYHEAVGRRKTAVARVRITARSKQSVKVNERDFDVYFPTKELQATVLAPLKGEGVPTFAIEARVQGGGVSAQAEALRHGIARALIKHDEELRRPLKVEGFLRRDARKKERKKFGLRGARRAPQWSKR